MPHFTRNYFYFIIITLLILPKTSLAIPAITCHCFTDRSFEPDRPAAADPYFLATVQNSFFAIVFNTDKKSIVMKKQQGTSSDDLWIAYWVASKSGATADTLLRSKKQSDTWKNVIFSLQLSQKPLGVRFSNAINADASAGRLSEAVVDEIFIKEKLLTEGDLIALRKAGVTNQELIIVTVIAFKTRQPARQLYLEVKNGSKTWGSLLSVAKINSKNMQMEVEGMLKTHPR